MAFIDWAADELIPALEISGQTQHRQRLTGQRWRVTGVLPDRYFHPIIYRACAASGAPVQQLAKNERALGAPMELATYVVYLHGFEGKSPFKHFMNRRDAEGFARSNVNTGLAAGAYLYEVAEISDARLAIEAVKERTATFLRPFTAVASKDELKRQEEEDARRLLTELGLL